MSILNTLVYRGLPSERTVIAPKITEHIKGIAENDAFLKDECRVILAAHLHCPPLIPALAAEMLISVLNQSMDSFDQSGAASLIEEEMVQWLCRKFEYK